eukprot:UN34064
MTWRDEFGLSTTKLFGRTNTTNINNDVTVGNTTSVKELDAIPDDQWYDFFDSKHIVSSNTTRAEINFGIKVARIVGQEFHEELEKGRLEVKQLKQKLITMNNNNNNRLFDNNTTNRNNAGGFSFMGGTNQTNKETVNQYKQKLQEMRDKMSQLHARNEDLEKYRKSRITGDLKTNDNSSMRSVISQLESQLRNLDGNIVSKFTVLTNEIQQQSPKELIVRFLQKLQNCNSNNLSRHVNTELNYQNEQDVRQLVNLTKNTSYDIKTMKTGQIKIEEYARRIQQNSEVMSQNMSSKLKQIQHHLTSQGYKIDTGRGVNGFGNLNQGNFNVDEWKYMTHGLSREMAKRSKKVMKTIRERVNRYVDCVYGFAYYTWYPGNLNKDLHDISNKLFRDIQSCIVCSINESLKEVTSFKPPNVYDLKNDDNLFLEFATTIDYRSQKLSAHNMNKWAHYDIVMYFL